MALANSTATTLAELGHQRVLFALTAWGKTRAARVAFAAYALVMHVYVFALLRFGGGGPRATNTETATSVG